jgi:hypothetical protein
LESVLIVLTKVIYVFMEVLWESTCFPEFRVAFSARRRSAIGVVVVAAWWREMGR